MLFRSALTVDEPDAVTADEGADADRAVEREVAAALESVFPRIGLKSFIQLTSEEKRAQLNEMAKIVMGIRLYNREVGKGGAGLDNIEEQVYNSVMDLKETLEVETAELNDVVMQYQETIVYCQLRAPAGVTPKALERWKDELANRRQYLSYLSSLQEDVIVSVRKVTNIRESFMNELDELQGLEASREGWSAVAATDGSKRRTRRRSSSRAASSEPSRTWARATTAS